jgi:hypothetical protein
METLAYILCNDGTPVRVDAEDLPRLLRYRWSASRGYPGAKDRPVYMHRLLLNAPRGAVVDHIHDDGMDNRKGGLRLCTHQQNMYRKQSRNRSGFRGAYATASGKFVTYVKARGVKHCCGTFVTPEEAARAYDAAALKHFGEFARLNFPKEAEA